MDSSTTKLCGRCGLDRPLDEFRIDKRVHKGVVKFRQHPWCSGCLTVYQAEQYQKHREKRLAESKAWRAANPDSVREHGRRASKRYAERHPDRQPMNTYLAWKQRLKRQGLTPEDYERILTDQGGVCAICGTDQPGGTQSPGRLGKFAADHCHASGQHRGLLCHRCNMGLGLFRDEPDLLRAAAAYLVAARPAGAVA